MITAIILAGGMGTRLRSVVTDVPKPMAPINGRPFLEHQMDYWIKHGVTQFVISVGYMKEVILDHFGVSYRNTPLTYAVEEQPLGTGGGLLLAAKGLSEPFLVLNGDTYFEVDLNKLQTFHAEKSSGWTFSLFKSNEPNRYMGVDVNDNGEIVSLNSTKANLGHMANGGVYLINPTVLEKLTFKLGHKMSLEDDLVSAFLKQGGKLFGTQFNGTFIDIGIPQDYYRAAGVLNH
jgi:D-glycero-alpha-D-manno-heptose 1-phosphate guanylyltransferase